MLYVIIITILLYVNLLFIKRDFWGWFHVIIIGLFSCVISVVPNFPLLFLDVCNSMHSS